MEYILEGNLLEKSVKRPFVVLFPYCRCTSHIYAREPLLGPGISFYRKSKIMLKENQIMK